MVRPPFSLRQDPEQVEEFLAVQRGVTEGLRPSLLRWTLEQYSGLILGVTDQGKLERLERILGRQVVFAHQAQSSELSQALGGDDELLLDATDVALNWSDSHRAETLEAYFVEARSEFCVRTDANGAYELQFRQSAEMSDLIEQEASATGRAAEHIRNAWSKSFGLNPDTKGACIEAVSAVEVVAKPAISPDNSRTTLGTLCRDMEAKPSKWETDSEYVSSVETVLSMMKMVWNEGHYRHGDESAPLEVSQEAAEMTVQTAVLLVSWFGSERIRLKQ